MPKKKGTTTLPSILPSTHNIRHLAQMLYFLVGAPFPPPLQCCVSYKFLYINHSAPIPPKVPTMCLLVDHGGELVEHSLLNVLVLDGVEAPVLVLCVCVATIHTGAKTYLLGDGLFAFIRHLKL